MDNYRKIYFFKNEGGTKITKIKEWIPCEKTLIVKVQMFFLFLVGIAFFIWSILLEGDARDLAALASFFVLMFATFNTIRINNKTKPIVRDPWCDELWMIEGANFKLKEENKREI